MVDYAAKHNSFLFILKQISLDGGFRCYPECKQKIMFLHTGRGLQSELNHQRENMLLKTFCHPKFFCEKYIAN